ncbi:MAG: hypothetical protein AB2551_21010 [Candidatus Thiodiazotropha sp.]
MIDTCKVHKLITLFQVSGVLLSCLVSALGVVIDHPLVHYAGYAVLAGLASIVVTSLIMGVLLLLSRWPFSKSSDEKVKHRTAWLSWKKYQLFVREVVAKPGVVPAKPCRKKPAY